MKERPRSVFNAHGPCSVCKRFKSVRGSIENPEPRPEDHDPACAAILRKRREEAALAAAGYEQAHGKSLDLWER